MFLLSLLKGVVLSLCILLGTKMAKSRIITTMPLRLKLLIFEYYNDILWPFSVQPNNNAMKQSKNHSVY